MVSSQVITVPWSVDSNNASSSALPQRRFAVQADCLSITPPMGTPILNRRKFEIGAV
jgi:hypothetical protein